MKQSFRTLALSALTMLGSGAAFAADWVVPTPAFHAMVPAESSAKTADTVYVWNVGQQGFIAGGEAYGTQAAVASLSSEKWVVIKTSEDGVFKLKNAARSGKYLFRTYGDGNVGSGVKACFVDGGDNANTWAIANVAGDVYTIQMSETASDVDADKNPFNADQFLGVQLNHASNWASSNNGGVTKGVYFDVPISESAANCQWGFVSKAAYDVYAAKTSMKTLLEDAESRGLDVSAEGAVFNNANATLQEVNEAIDALNAKVLAVVTPENPMSMTHMFKNADFEANSVSGWTTTTGAQNKGTATNKSTDTAANNEGAFNNYFYENWKSSNFKGRMYQTVKNLPEGIYKVGIAAFVASLDDDNATHQKQYVYANDEKVLLTRANPRAYTITLSLAGTDTLQIGLASDSTITNWMGLDNVTLTYLGNSIESYRYLSSQLLPEIEATISDNEDESFNYTESVYEAAKAAAQEGIDASDKQASYDAYLKAKAGLADLKANVAAYIELYKAAEGANDAFYNEYSDQQELLDASEEGFEMHGARTASTEELQAMIKKIADALQQAKLNSYQVGDDVTNLIANATFNDETAEATYTQPQNKKGWIGADVIGAGWITDTRLAEVYNLDCDIHQDLKGLKKGAYRLSIQAFYRPSAASSAAYQAYLNGDSLTQAYIYMGLTQQRVKSIYACTFPESITTVSRENHWINVGGDDPLYVPNTMDESYVAMNGSVDGEQDPAYDNNYRNVVYGVVTENGGSMPIGFKIENHSDGSWVIFRDFRLEYLGNDPVYIKPVLDNKIKEAQTDFVGQKMAAADKAAIDKAVAEGQAATAGTDGDAMMSAFTAIANAEDQAKASMKAYTELTATYDSLQAQYDGSDKATAEAKASALNLLNEVKAMLNDGTIAAADVPAKQVEMRAAMKALMVQPGSDDDPTKYTAWIQNPTYGKQDGWTVNKKAGDGNPGIQYNTMEIWNATADVYQVIEGLPEGTYEVRVQSLFRPVSADEAWKDLLGDSIEDYGKRAVIYANSDSITPTYWCSKYDPDSYSWTTGGYSNMVDSVLDTSADTLMAVTYHFANNRQAAEYQFQMNYYPVQSFFTYVNESGVLRLGFRNNAHKGQDWFVVSNWQLYYYGKNSVHAESTGIDEIGTDSNIQFNEIYTVDGRRVNTLQKGLNIVRGKAANGRIVTKKIVLK